MTKEYTNKIAIVTGNAKGLGKRISERLLELGYQEPETIRSADYDLSNAEDAARLVQDTIAKYGRLDLLVNNIGNYVAKSIDDISVAEWEDLIGSNLNTSFYMSKYALPYLRKSHGKIINIGFASLETCSPKPNIIAYHSAKMGLLSLTQGLAKSEASNGVLVNMVSPGSMENTVKHNAIAAIPLGRLATLDEVTDAVLFLVSSDYITGQNLEVSGGWGYESSSSSSSTVAVILSVVKLPVSTEKTVIEPLLVPSKFLKLIIKV